jgi:hypothetical protein
MNCPVCDKPMRKVRWSITNNAKKSKNYKEYDSTTYQCLIDDVWVNTEVPISKSEKSIQS